MRPSVARTMSMIVTDMLSVAHALMASTYARASILVYLRVAHLRDHI